MIVVKPMNTMAPVVTTNTGLQLFEGQSRPLRSDRNLRISDEDNLDDVKVREKRNKGEYSLKELPVLFSRVNEQFQKVGKGSFVS
jgi:hypothetical protein